MYMYMYMCMWMYIYVCIYIYAHFCTIEKTTQKVITIPHTYESQFGQWHGNAMPAMDSCKSSIEERTLHNSHRVDAQSR